MKNNLFKIMVVGLAVLSVSLSGCETLKKKFTREPQKQKKSPVAALDSGAAQSYPNSVLYQSHYVLWKSWQDELVISLGGNHKKETECAERALSEQKGMKNLLNEAGQAAIEPFVVELENLASRVENGNLSFAGTKQLKNELDQYKSRFEKKFHYHKITSWIKPDQPINEQ
jgi:hypothetical protein